MSIASHVQEDTTQSLKRIKAFSAMGVLTPAFIAIGSFNLFLYNLGSPDRLYFDEIRYVPAARQLLHHGINENWSHPNLAKLLIALGIQLLGDHPLGWRIMSAVFGVLTILGVYGLGLALFRNRTAAVQCAVLALFNQVVFVQSRIATLDIFLTGLLLPALAIFAWIWMDDDPLGRTIQRRAWVCAILFGLAIGAKWIAAVPMLVCWLLLGLASRDANRKRYLKVVPWILLVVGGTYLLTLVPLLGMDHPSYAPGLLALDGHDQKYGFIQILQLQFEMLRTQLMYANPHPYFSHWYTWPLMLRPIWYFREDGNGTSSISAVILLGNPLILWMGLLSALYALWAWIKRRNRIALLLISLYASLFVIWGVFPRMASTFYYYLPASTLLGPMLVFAAQELRIGVKLQWSYLISSAAIFLYFYPLLANLPLSQAFFASHLWFSTWW